MLNSELIEFSKKYLLELLLVRLQLTLHFLFPKWLKMVVSVLKTSNHNIQFNVMNDRITDNLMFIWHIYAHWAIFLHLPAAVCAIVFKQLMFATVNLFHHEHTNQLRDAHREPKLVGKYARAREFRKTSLVNRYNPFHLNIGCILSRARVPDQLGFQLKEVLKVLKVDNPTDSVLI